MAKRKVVKVIDPIENQGNNLLRDINECEHSIKIGILTAPPVHRILSIGDRVNYGAHKECYIHEVYHNGYYYHVEVLNVVRERNGEPKDEQRISMWHDIIPYGNAKPTNFHQEENYRLKMLNSSVSSLIHMVLNSHSGVEFNVDYQRDYVWTIDDKIALIDSVFNNIDIGKFVLVQCDLSVDGKLYEIIDGKQRLSTLTDFYCDQFKYNGYYYSELSNSDKNKFEEHSVSYGYLENPTKKAILETFIKVNTTGKIMDKKHIDSVKELLKNL